MPKTIFSPWVHEGSKITIHRGLESFSDSDYSVLDLTSGHRKLWVGKSSEGVLFLDKRKEVKPDLVASNAFLPFQDEVFCGIVYDPSHILKGGGYFPKTTFARRYGYWKNKSEFLRNLEAVNVEAARVLDIDNGSGRLLVHWTECASNPVRFHQLTQALTNFELVGLEARASKSGNSWRSVIFDCLFRRLAQEREIRGHAVAEVACVVPKSVEKPSKDPFQLKLAAEVLQA